MSAARIRPPRLRLLPEVSPRHNHRVEPNEDAALTDIEIGGIGRGEARSGANERSAPGVVQAPGSPTFALHTLGWRAFQDLCAAVLRHVWGQSVQPFADSNDGGRDGAFYGVWSDHARHEVLRDLPEGPFVMQCKHTKASDSTLSLSDLSDEFAKVEALVERGLCRSYVLQTNARVTGASEADIRERLLRTGVEHPLILAGQWICETIALNRTLRLYVPRVYGLGDLSQILDERAYAQTAALIASARDQVATFVMTEPYRKAANALREQGFVLLLGEPAVGKSVIALMLAIAAADNWGCATVKATSASEVVARWNVHENKQFFWVDDAFGAVTHEDALSHEWSRHLPHVMTAIAQGTRVVLTSRSYIYNDARRLLKEYAYPLLREHQVIVDVENLTHDERAQILYNHLALGDQPTEVRQRMKPFLEAAAAAQPFRPEAARRLGLRAFTTNLSLTRSGIETFMSSPRQVLQDVFDQLGPNEQAALALVYAAGRGGAIEEPVDYTAAENEIIDRAGGTAAGTARALRSLTGDFLNQANGPTGNRCFTFRHPTLWEGFASWLPAQPHLLPVVLSGLSNADLLTRVDCHAEGSRQAEGILLRVPPPLYGSVANRIVVEQRVVAESTIYNARQRSNAREYIYNFLARRCSDEFLRVYLELDPKLPERLVKFTSYVEAVPEPALLARLYEAQILSEPIRLRAIDNMAYLATTTPDAGWLENYEWSVLMTESDRADLMAYVRDELVPRLESAVADWAGQADPQEEDDPVPRQLLTYSTAFEADGDPDTAYAFTEAQDWYDQFIEPDRYDPREWEPRAPREPSDLVLRSGVESGPSSRSTFDDVDE